jgi:hypothetical protein
MERNIKIGLEGRLARCELRLIGIEFYDYTNEPSVIVNYSFQYLKSCGLPRENHVLAYWLVGWLAGRSVVWLVSRSGLSVCLSACWLVAGLSVT